ncbi:MAG TPA: helix-turn-helix transcriptional regulator [Caulobacteraceae bacterium]|nr:helix-turn-helix transcriptional regulator [Caulobacteraceae bacterium]
MANPIPTEIHPVDLFVGQRIRAQRRLLRISQEQMARQLGLTFQQVQKYERGANRVSASKLFDISQILGVPISFFFDGLEGSGAASKSAEHLGAVLFQASEEGVELLSALARLSPSARRHLLKFCQIIGAELAGAPQAVEGLG